MTRAEINKEIGYLAHGKLRMAEDDYRTLVYSIDKSSGGFVRNIKDDETANLVLVALRNMVDKKINPTEKQQARNDAQVKFIARLMDFLKWEWRSTSLFILRIVGKSHTSKCTAAELSKVIRGMIAIIDSNIESGKLVLSPAKLKEYRFKTHFHRVQNKTKSQQKEIQS